jgi:hypothetical protein
VTAWLFGADVTWLFGADVIFMREECADVIFGLIL